MAIRTFAAESMVWRTVGLIAPEESLKTIEEYAVECSIVKVYASEVLDYVVDEGVQIHGGYGYHQDYLVERAYRDSRINRIFEGTNEINRLLIAGMLLKRAARGQLALLPAVQSVLNGKFTATAGSGDGDEEMRLTHNAKQIALLALGIASQEFGTELQKQQEVLMSISDIIMEALAMESSLLRSRKCAVSRRGGNAAEMCAVFLREAMDRVEVSCRNVLGACLDGEALRRHMSVLRSLANYDPSDAVALRRRIANRLLASERYVCD
jgi:alkylation response protein AidB-like acyl-CoA dehydrogenase